MGEWESGAKINNYNVFFLKKLIHSSRPYWVLTFNEGLTQTSFKLPLKFRSCHWAEQQHLEKPDIKLDKSPSPVIDLARSAYA